MNTWVKVEAGKYVCGTWTISKTYSRSGWRVFDSVTKFNGYGDTLRQAKDMASFNGCSKPLVEIL